jgi:hypothetical protein
VTGNSSAYALSTTGGVVAMRVEHSMNTAPSVANNYATGIVSETIQRRVRLSVIEDSDMDSGAPGAVSTAVLEVHSDRSYAINSWVIDP